MVGLLPVRPTTALTRCVDHTQATPNTCSREPRPPTMRTPAAASAAPCAVAMSTGCCLPSRALYAGVALAAEAALTPPSSWAAASTCG